MNFYHPIKFPKNAETNAAILLSMNFYNYILRDAFS